MNLIKLDTKEEINSFLSSREHSPFLESFEWGELQEEYGYDIFRYGIKENEKIVGAATLIKKSLALNLNYFYIPRGPVISNQSIFDFFINEIKTIANKEKCIFLRIEPEFKIEFSKYKIVQSLDIQPSKTLVMNLTKTENQLLEIMHQKTRYNIKLAEKRGVNIYEANINNFEKFWELAEKTSNRDNFRLHNKEYYRKMLLKVNNVKYFKKDELIIKLFFSEYNNKNISANIVSFFGDTVTYLHGASDNQYREVMAPYALQWHVIKLAKSLGYKYYDFYGIDENKWPGVTRFKSGFGGEELNYEGTFDLILNKNYYNIYRILRKIRRRL